MIRTLMRKLKDTWQELNRSIYVGERLQSNLRVLTYVSLVSAFMGLVLLIIDIIQREWVMTAASCVVFLCGLGCAYFAHVKKNRRVAAVIPTAFCIVMFTMYIFTGFAEGTAIFWTLMMPIGISYFVGVKYDVILTAYFSVLYLVVFSDLPCTQWNWFVVPFCPLPFVFWKWRRWWALPFAAVCLFWVLGMLVYPHQIVDSAHLVLATAMAVCNVEIRLKSQK